MHLLSYISPRGLGNCNKVFLRIIYAVEKTLGKPKGFGRYLALFKLSGRRPRRVHPAEIRRTYHALGLPRSGATALVLHPRGI